MKEIKNQLGRTLLETLMVLSVMGLLSMLVLYGMHFALIKSRVVKTIDLINKSVAGVLTSRVLEGLQKEYDPNNDTIVALSERIEPNVYISDVPLLESSSDEAKFYGMNAFKTSSGAVISVNALLNGLGVIVNLNQVSTEICSEILKSDLEYEAVFRLNSLYSSPEGLSLNDEAIFFSQDMVDGDVERALCSPEKENELGLKNVVDIAFLFKATQDVNSALFSCDDIMCYSCEMCVLGMCLPKERKVCGVNAYYDYRTCSCICFAGAEGAPDSGCECPSGLFVDVSDKRCIVCQTNLDCYERDQFTPFCADDGMSCKGCADYAEKDEMGNIIDQKAFFMPEFVDENEEIDFDPNRDCKTCAESGKITKDGTTGNSLVCVECNQDSDCNNSRICNMETNTCECSGMKTWDADQNKCICKVKGGDYFNSEMCDCENGYETSVSENEDGSSAQITCYQQCIGIGMTGERDADGVCLCNTSTYEEKAIITEDGTQYCQCDEEREYFNNADGTCVQCRPASEAFKDQLNGAANPDSFIDGWYCGRGLLGSDRLYNPHWADDSVLQNGDKYCPTYYILMRENTKYKTVKYNNIEYRVIDVDKSSGQFKCTECWNLTDRNGKKGIAEMTQWAYCGCSRFNTPVYYTTDKELASDYAQKKKTGGYCNPPNKEYVSWYQNGTSEFPHARGGYSLAPFDLRNAGYKISNPKGKLGWNWDYNFIADNSGITFEEGAKSLDDCKTEKSTETAGLSGNALIKKCAELFPANRARSDCGYEGEMPIWDRDGRRVFNYGVWLRNTPAKCHPDSYYYFQTDGPKETDLCSYEWGCQEVGRTLTPCGNNAAVYQCKCDGTYVNRNGICCHKNYILKDKQCVACTNGSIPNTTGTACVPCDEGQYVSNGVCKNCGSGQELNANRTGCVDCGINEIVQNGQCTSCDAGGIPNEDKTACTHCANGMVKKYEYSTGGVLQTVFCECPISKPIEITDKITQETYCRSDETDMCYNGICCSKDTYPVCSNQDCTIRVCCSWGYRYSSVIGSCILCNASDGYGHILNRDDVWGCIPSN